MNISVWNNMVQVICYTIVALVLPFVSVFSVSTDANDAYNYILLIQDVHSYYGTACIIIVHSDSYTEFNETSLTYIWHRTFSERGILTMIVSFPELARVARKYYLRRPLYIVVLATKESMNEFSMVTKQIDISFPAWFVMFLPYQGNPLQSACQKPVGNPFNLLFNTEMLVLCYSSPILTEWYATRDNQTRVFNLATWKPGQGITLRTGRSLYARRNDMFGEIIRVSVVEGSQFIMAKNGVLSLFFGSVIQELSKSMNFTIEVVSSMPAYGSWNKEEQIWTGVIGEVASNRADLGVAEFTMTNHRLNAVDFTLPMILSRNKIYFKKPDGSSVQWSAYFKTLDTDIWTAIVCLIISTPILLTIMKTKGRVGMKILADNYIYVWGIYCQQGLSEFPKESSLRLAFLSISVSALIILSAYSASLTSFLTVSTISLPFSTIEEFAAYSSYKLIVFRNSADYDMIISANDSVFAKVKKQLKKKQDLPLTVHDAFTQVCNEKVGFYVTEAIRNAISRLPCETVYIEGDEVDTMAPVLNKRSPYTGVMNYYLQRFKDNGALNRLRNMFLVTRDSSKNGYPVVNLGGIAPILSVLAGGIFLGCLVLMLEKIYYKICNSKCKEAFRYFFSRKFCDEKFGGIRRNRAKQIQGVARNIRHSIPNNLNQIFTYDQ